VAAALVSAIRENLDGVTVAVGVALSDASASSEGLRARANDAMYAAKRAGGDQACLDGRGEAPTTGRARA
jgi:GGDEF domain-containing protein